MHRFVSCSCLPTLGNPHKAGVMWPLESFPTMGTPEEVGVMEPLLIVSPVLGTPKVRSGHPGHPFFCLD